LPPRVSAQKAAAQHTLFFAALRGGRCLFSCCCLSINIAPQAYTYVPQQSTTTIKHHPFLGNSFPPAAKKRYCPSPMPNQSLRDACSAIKNKRRFYLPPHTLPNTPPPPAGGDIYSLHTPNHSPHLNKSAVSFPSATALAPHAALAGCAPSFRSCLPLAPPTIQPHTNLRLLLLPTGFLRIAHTLFWQSCFVRPLRPKHHPSSAFPEGGIPSFCSRSPNPCFCRPAAARWREPM
jgi:hypothetical protein